MGNGKYSDMFSGVVEETGQLSSDGMKIGTLHVTVDNQDRSTGTKTFTTATPTTSAAQIMAANSNRQSARIHNNGAAVVYLGKDASVTVANGFPLAAGAFIDDETSKDAWFAIMAAGTGDLRIMEIAGA